MELWALRGHAACVGDAVGWPTDSWRACSGLDVELEWMGCPKNNPACIPALTGRQAAAGSAGHCAALSIQEDAAAGPACSWRTCSVLVLKICGGAASLAPACIPAQTGSRLL